MRLSTIKLSGFKSFVDPTTLHFPTNMTGIVGPNGCGKSNIIDAIRWVMGESAASRLRGDAITDVIFSGSGQRKPVGSAQVELIFDNSDGTIQGEYAKFSEISIKRQVSRDGQSHYFLNNVRCRRRDIVDVFLGTGLGARSYSIIEQGMISQIVEARPEELRAHLEEAAGISKYKERRKETESRMRVTKENLDRLNDLRQEIEKQLEHLNRQARQAERYQKLKDQYVRADAELNALHLRDLNRELEDRRTALRRAELQVERLTAEQRAIETRLEEERSKQIEATEHFNSVQAELYRVGGEIARVEQQIAYNRDLGERLQRATKETEIALQEVNEHILGDQQQIELLRQALAEADPRNEMLRAEANARQEALWEAEAALGDWQARWDAYARESAESARAAEVERTQLKFLDQQSLETSNRIAKLEVERRGIDLASLGDAVDSLQRKRDQIKERIEHLSQALDARKRALAEVQEQKRDLQHRLSEVRSSLETAKGRIASLEALQHAALGQENSPAAAWFEAVGLGRARRLGEILQVQEGWERAVETVLTGWLDAVINDDPHHFGAELTSLREGQVTIMSARPGRCRGEDRLSARVQGPEAVIAVLDRILIADSFDEAKRIAACLDSGESVITRDGEWLGRDWLRVARGSEAGSGVLVRERELQALARTIQNLEAEIESLLSQQRELEQANFDAERARDEVQRELYFAHRQFSEISGQIESERGRIETAQRRIAAIDAELAELRVRSEQVQAHAREARGRLEIALTQMGDQEVLRRHLDAERRQLLERREDARAAAREATDKAHQLALEIEAKRSTLASLEQSLSRLMQQRIALETRKSELANQIATQRDPSAQLEAELRTYLDQRMLIDKQLIEARKALEASDLAYRALDQERHRIERELTNERETLTSIRLDEQSLRLRAERHAEAIAAAGYAVESLFAELPPEAEIGDWEAKVADIDQKIRRLGPVNLAAIQEYAELATRKTYLDAQHNDLTQALEMLESAIKKIDRETRTRFKETFDKVNAGLQELFPRLFGGGHAYLELTGEDLLDTGVTIMARPPGKRVTSISLLSGGEKALTAVALLFAIFRLNPAPFCLLDEVDAPLDEANVGRFCDMLTEMSERVQFVFVTHNKITMEAASQLCGVTMREPGVSRLVSVDLTEASRLAGVA